MDVTFWGILVALGLLGLADVFGSSSDETDEDGTEDASDENQTPTTENSADIIAEADENGTDTEDMSDADLSASLFLNDDGTYTVELGDDETGHVVAVKSEHTGDHPTFEVSYTLDLFLVPDGAEIPITATESNGFPFISLEQMEQDLGLTNLGSFDLGSTTDETDTRVDPPVIISDDPINVIRITSYASDGATLLHQSENDETMSPFEIGGNFFDGAESIETDGNFVGTGDTDFVISQSADGGAGGITISTGGGNDLVLSSINQSTVNGGMGNDRIVAAGNESLIYGGGGSDDISVGENGTAYGGEGSDNLSSFGTSAYIFNDILVDNPDTVPNLGVELYGDAGDDYIRASGTTTAYGGTGDDGFTLARGSLAFGEEGDDRFNLDPGATAYGGIGDDRFQMVSFADTASEPTAVVTGGAGSDTYDFHIRGAYIGTDGQYLQITDFDPNEDILEIGGWANTNLTDVRIEEAPDGSYTDVIAEFRQPTNIPGGGTSTATIRLDGVSGYTVEQLVA